MFRFMQQTTKCFGVPLMSTVNICMLRMTLMHMHKDENTK